MCGIYGSTIQYSDEIIMAKLNRVRFRGPDFSAFSRDENVILGHNRLAIIDLDHRADQPFTYEYLKIVFNGEIYNYKEVKKTLIEKGYKFNSESDTEVICAAYIEYGETCVSHFNGMFAFVIYDKKRKKLFGARDRLGKKPFYYINNHLGFEFSSQPSQIAIDRHLSINKNAVNAFLFWNYIPEPLSIYNDVKKLQAGTYFVFDIGRQKFEITPYWEIDYRWKQKYSGSYNEAREDLKTILYDAVKIRLNADVPLGIFLSSGVDSSLIAAIASKFKSNVQTFNIRFNEKKYDESYHSRLIAQHIGTEHHTIDCDYKEGIALIENYAKYFDEPFADPSAIPGLLLAKHTKSYVTVALTGDGGDENFLGYGRYMWAQKAELIYNVPLIMRKAIAWFINLSPNYRHKIIAMGLNQKNLVALYIKMCGTIDNSWMLEPSSVNFNSNRFLLINNYKPILERISDYDIKTYLNEDINTKVDRASMAYAVECRAPLMDYRVVEFARSLPTEFKVKGSVQKRILKDILFEHVPANFYKRPKSGFTVPFKDWFRNELKDYVLDNLNKKNLLEIPGIQVDKVEKMIGEHMSGKWNRFPLIWSLLVLSQWMQKSKTYSNAAFTVIN